MTSVFDKLNLKQQRAILVLDAPMSFDNALANLSEVRIIRRAGDAELYDFALIFATRQTEVNKAAETVIPQLTADAVLWFAYPKGTSKRYTCDFNRDTGWSELLRLGFDTVRQVAIDEDWSALRFRRHEFIKR